ncbi:MAG: peptidoglycan D,D-transpeptidase FtsI family protein [Coprococcus sp.]
MAKRAKKFLKKMKKKLLIAYLAAVACFVLLAVRVIYLGIAKGEEYSEEVLSQKKYDSLDIPYERGEIVDRNGNVLATSEKVYNLILEPKNILSTDKNREATQKALETYFGLTKDDFDSYMEDTDSFYKMAIKGLAYSKVKEFKEYCNSKDGKNVIGVRFEEEYKRRYPNGNVACHILGYTSSGNVGQGGIEGYYNSYLNGTNGKTYGYLTNDNTVESVTVPAVNGYTVVSTIDVNIQKILEDNIAEYMETTGAKKIGIIAMNPTNGEILGMSCSHSYNPNSPMDTTALRNMKVTVTQKVNAETGEEVTTEAPTENSEEGSEEETTTEEVTTEQITTEEVEYDFSQMSDEEFNATIDGFTNDQLYEALNSVWRNYCISDIYEPGSTFKPITVAGALEDGIVSDGDTFYCDGYETVVEGGSPIYCHNPAGEGTLTLKQTIENSCNDAMMQISRKEGAKIFDKYQEIFNIGSVTGIDLPGEAAGIKYDEDTLNPAELATSSFGQGVSVTMIQLAAAFSSIVNGGDYYVPHVVKQILDDDGSIIEDIEPELVRKTISKENSDLMRSYLLGVVENGTGGRAAVEGYTIGGKTGTAEKLPRGNGKYVLSFIGCSPIENPQIVVYVVVDEPNVESQDTSGAGARLFHEVMVDLLPYMNVYQSNGDNTASTGQDEPINSVFENDGTGADTTEDGMTGEDTSESDTAESDTTEVYTTDPDITESYTSEADTTESYTVEESITESDTGEESTAEYVEPE